MYNIEISPRYVADMNATINYISDVLCNMDAAMNLKNKADVTIDDIAKNPQNISTQPLTLLTKSAIMPFVKKGHFLLTKYNCRGKHCEPEKEDINYEVKTII